MLRVFLQTSEIAPRVLKRKDQRGTDMSVIADADEGISHQLLLNSNASVTALTGTHNIWIVGSAVEAKAVLHAQHLQTESLSKLLGKLEEGCLCILIPDRFHMVIFLIDPVTELLDVLFCYAIICQTDRSQVSMHRISSPHSFIYTDPPPALPPDGSVYISCSYGTRTFFPPMYGCSASGIVTLPSACR